MANDQNAAERRQYPRTVFAAEEELWANFVVTRTPQKGKSAQVMNFSRGGLGLVVKRSAVDDIVPGARLMVRDLGVKNNGSVNLSYLEMDVMWVLDHDFLDNIGFGCQFCDPNEKAIVHLMEFIRRYFPGRLK